MARQPQFTLHDTAWTLGLTVRNSGTYHPNVYYLPVKVEIWAIEKEYLWDDDWKKKNILRFRYNIDRPKHLDKRSKKDKWGRITKHAFTGGHENWCEEQYLFSDKQSALKECKKWNKK